MATVPAAPKEEYVHQHFPKHVFSQNSSKEIENRIVESAEALDDLTLESGRTWYESPGEAKRGKADPPKPIPEKIGDENARLREHNEALLKEIAALKAKK